MSWNSPSAQAGIGSEGRGPAVLSVLLGAGFTLILFLGIAHFQGTAPGEPPPDSDTVRAVALPLEPPPPRVVPLETEPAVSVLTGIEAAPSDSPVKLTVPPPELAEIDPSPPVAPPAVIQVGQLYTEFKPRMNFVMDTQRIFQSSEVDQPPKVLYTVTPNVTRRMLKDAKSARVTVMLIIDTSGAVSNVTLAQSSGNLELDTIMLQNIREWTFSPAIKKGKRVKCLIQQGYNVRMPAATPFVIF